MQDQEVFVNPVQEAVKQIRESVTNFKEFKDCGKFLKQIAFFLDLDIDVTVSNAAKVCQDYAWHMKNVSGSLAMCHAACVKHFKLKKSEQYLIMKDTYPTISATALKALVEGACADEEATLVLAERLDRRMSHIIDLARSTISLYKTELDKGL